MRRGHDGRTRCDGRRKCNDNVVSRGPEVSMTLQRFNV